jgi:hypothetical protein
LENIVWIKEIKLVAKIFNYYLAWGLNNLDIYLHDIFCFPPIWLATGGLLRLCLMSEDCEEIFVSDKFLFPKFTKWYLD